jgi:hypothetical protein
VALVIDPPISGRVADDVFLRTVASSIPTYAALPIWRGTRSGDTVNRHIQIADGWEAFIVSVPDDFWANVEFQRWEPMGRFYLRRLHDDDASAKVRRASLGRILDLGRAASRVAEAGPPAYTAAVQCTGPGGILFASCLTASVIRRQVAAPS